MMDVIILAAGKGTRMRSDLLKVAHEVAGKPILNYVIEAVQAFESPRIYLVVGHQRDHVKIMTEKYDSLSYVEQLEQLGTGHAVQQVESHINLEEEGRVLILAGDCPLISSNSLQHLITTHADANAAGSILTTIMDDPASYGRIIREDTGDVKGIREAKDCTTDELKVQEINTGIYCFQKTVLFEALGKITTNNVQQEYY